jgi:hypothetical protein
MIQKNGIIDALKKAPDQFRGFFLRCRCSCFALFKSVMCINFRMRCFLAAAIAAYLPSSQTPVEKKSTESFCFSTALLGLYQ